MSLHSEMSNQAIKLEIPLKSELKSEDESSTDSEDGSYDSNSSQAEPFPRELMPLWDPEQPWLSVFKSDPKLEPLFLAYVFKCETGQCIFACAEEVNIKKHMAKHDAGSYHQSEGAFHCFYCWYSSATPTSMKHHLQACHPDGALKCFIDEQRLTDVNSKAEQSYDLKHLELLECGKLTRVERLRFCDRRVVFRLQAQVS